MSKRGNGEGSIYKRADGRYAAAASLQAGKRKTVYGRTRTEVQEKLVRLQRDQQLGAPVADERMTVGRLLTDWLDSSIAPSKRANTVSAYSSWVNNHIIPGLGRVKVARLTPQMVERFLLSKRTTLSPRSIHHIRAVLRAALNHALKWGLVQRNAAELVDLPRLQRHEITIFTPEQAMAFVDGVSEDPRGAVYVVALTVGLRQGEALGLQWRDIDLDAMSLTVRHSLQRVGGGTILAEPKSETSHRTLALPSLTVDALRRRRSEQLQDRLRAGGEWYESDLVFTDQTGRPLNGSATTRRFHRVLAELGLPDMRFHDLRHSCASLLLAKNVHPRLVMEMLGHSSYTLTMNTYSHVIPALRREVADQMEAVFARA